KIRQCLVETIQLSRYSYDDTLADSIWKTAILVGDQEFRNPGTCKSEAKRIRDTYEQQTTFDEVVQTGMGKEALNGVMRWINEDLKLKLSKIDILNSIVIDNIPGEIQAILESLRSKESKPIPIDIPVIPEEKEDDSDEAIMRQLELM